MRETRINRFDIFYSKNWRADIQLFSSIGEFNMRDENFSASLNLPIDNTTATPDEIKIEIFNKLKSTIKEIAGYLEDKTFDSLVKE